MIVENKPLSELEKFEKAAKPLMEYLSNSDHPHYSVIVTNNNAELVEGQMMAMNNPIEIQD